MGGSFESLFRAALQLVVFATVATAPIAWLLLRLLSRHRGEPPRRPSGWSAALFLVAIASPLGLATYFNWSWLPLIGLVLATAWYQRSIIRALITVPATVATWSLAFWLGGMYFAGQTDTPRLPDPKALAPCFGPGAPKEPPKYSVGLFWSPQGRFLWQPSGFGFVRWDVQDLSNWRRFLAPFQRSLGVGSICEIAAGWTPDAEHFFAADAVTLRIWSADGALVETLPMPRPNNRWHGAWNPALSVGAKLIAQRDFTEPRQVNVLEPRGKVVRQFSVPNPIELITFLVDGRLVIWNPPLLSIADEGGDVRSSLRIEGSFHMLLPGRADHVFLWSKGCRQREVNLSTAKVTNPDERRCRGTSPDLRFEYELDIPSQRLVILDRKSGRPIVREPPPAEPRVCSDFEDDFPGKEIRARSTCERDEDCAIFYHDGTCLAARADLLSGELGRRISRWLHLACSPNPNDRGVWRVHPEKSEMRCVALRALHPRCAEGRCTLDLDD